MVGSSILYKPWICTIQPKKSFPTRPYRNRKSATPSMIKKTEEKTEKTNVKKQKGGRRGDETQKSKMDANKNKKKDEKMTRHDKQKTRRVMIRISPRKKLCLDFFHPPCIAVTASSRWSIISISVGRASRLMRAHNFSVSSAVHPPTPFRATSSAPPATCVVGSCWPSSRDKNEGKNNGKNNYKVESIHVLWGENETAMHKGRRKERKWKTHQKKETWTWLETNKSHGKPTNVRKEEQRGQHAEACYIDLHRCTQIYSSI